MHQQACKTQIPLDGFTLRRCPNSNAHCPPSHCDLYVVHPGSNAVAVTPHEPKFTKMREDFPDSSRTRLQNFKPLPFSAAEKSVTVRTRTHQEMR